MAMPKTTMGVISEQQEILMQGRQHKRSRSGLSTGSHNSAIKKDPSKGLLPKIHSTANSPNYRQMGQHLDELRMRKNRKIVAPRTFDKRNIIIDPARVGKKPSKRNEKGKKMGMVMNSVQEIPRYKDQHSYLQAIAGLQSHG